MSLFFVFDMSKKKYLLLCPGPVNIAKNVKRAFTTYEVGHRESEFVTLFKDIQKNLLKLFLVKNLSKYTPVIISGSGTAANEAVLSSIVGNKNILVLVNGEFGDRLYQMSRFHNQNTFVLRFAWGEKMNLKKIHAYIKEKNINIIAMVHHETSTGMLNPIEKIGIIAKKNKLIFFVDGVSSAGAEVISIEKAYITFFSSSASKALGCFPGVSFVIGEKKAFEALKDIPAKSIYLNLYNFYNFALGFFQTPNTPAVQTFYALNQALININKVGIEKIHKNTKELSDMIRFELRKLGFTFFIEEKDMSVVLTTVFPPNGISIPGLQYYLKKNGIIIYNGKGPLKDKAVQIANIGEISKDDIKFFFHVLKEFLILQKSRNISDSIYTALKHFTHLKQKETLTRKFPLIQSLNKNNKPHYFDFIYLLTKRTHSS